MMSPILGWSLHTGIDMTSNFSDGKVIHVSGMQEVNWHAAKMWMYPQSLVVFLKF